MKRLVHWMFLLMLLCAQVVYGNDVDKARRVAGVAAFDILLKPSENWDPLSDEARQYVGPLDARKSERFRVGCEIPPVIASEKDLWRTLNGMHRELQDKRTIKLAPGLTEKQVQSWLRDFNNLITMMAITWRDEEDLYLIVYYQTDARILAAFLNPKMEVKLTNEEKNVLNGCCKWIGANIRKGMPNLLKIRMVNDAVIDNTQYRLSCGKTADVVLRGLGKCAAYTTTTQLLLHMLGIDNRYVHGDVTTSPMSHAWNLVDVNGQWYHMDTTWNDPDGYQYFLLNDEEMGIDHSWPSRLDKLGLRYPKGPELNTVHFFTRADYANRERPSNPPLLPVDEDNTTLDSIWKRFTAGFEHEAAVLTDTENAPLGKSLPELPKHPELPPLLQGKKQIAEDKTDAEPQKTGNAYLVANEKDLNKVLQACADKLEGPEIRLQLSKPSALYNFRYWLKKSDIHTWVRAYSYKSNRKKPTDAAPVITLKVEYWPHVRLISASRDEKLLSKLSNAEKSALDECRLIAQAHGSKWKFRRQKIDNVYLHVLDKLRWEPGRSSVVTAMNDCESGSLGMAETLQVVYSLMNIPVKMVHGRTDKELQAWNLVQHLGERWFHSVAAQDAAACTTRRHVTKWDRRSDGRMRKTHAWFEAEVPAADQHTLDAEGAMRAVEKKTGRKMKRPL